MQRDECAIKTFSLQIQHIALSGIKQVRIHALLNQGRVHHCARLDGDLTLGRYTTKQHRHFAQIFFCHAHFFLNSHTLFHHIK